MGHTLVDRRVGSNVDNVANLVGLEVGRKLGRAMLTEVAREKVARLAAKTERVRHLLYSAEHIRYLK